MCGRRSCARTTVKVSWGSAGLMIKPRMKTSNEKHLELWRNMSVCTAADIHQQTSVLLSRQSCHVLLQSLKRRQAAHWFLLSYIRYDSLIPIKEQTKCYALVACSRNMNRHRTPQKRCYCIHVPLNIFMSALLALLARPTASHCEDFKWSVWPAGRSAMFNNCSGTLRPSPITNLWHRAEKNETYIINRPKQPKPPCQGQKTCQEYASGSTLPFPGLRTSNLHAACWGHLP